MKTMLLLSLIGLSSSISLAAEVQCRNVLRIQPISAYELQNKIIQNNLAQKYLNDQTPVVNKSYGSNAPIVHSFEKEGLFYKEISSWFPGMKGEMGHKFYSRYQKEMRNTTQRGPFINWIDKLKLKSTTPDSVRNAFDKMTTYEKVNFLATKEDPFVYLTIQDRSYLIEIGVIDFDDVAKGPNLPKGITVGDDIGSYEVRMSNGVADQRAYNNMRDQTEQYLDGKIGHQHLFHAWPDDANLRAQMAPYYIELLDSSTWYLYWRQIRRNPEVFSSILAHPYLGVYTRDSLNRLNQAVINNEPKKFKNKFRMIGARSFDASPDIPEQGTGKVPDWELRSGNKGAKREFVESTLEARLVSGDYIGMRSYQSYDFNPSAPIEAIAAPFLNAQEIAVLKDFEQKHPVMNYSASKLSDNHFRNRVISPLLPWENRLNLNYKMTIYKNAQQAYAKGLVKIAQDYLKEAGKNKKRSTVEISEMREETVSELEQLNYEFAQKVRLDLDFENYLMPVPLRLPSIKISSSGPIDVNQVGLGIEYSLRFPREIKPETKVQAKKIIESFANQYSKVIGQGNVTSLTSDGHGHGIAVKYKTTDSTGKDWRLEWDGIQRSYDQEGEVQNAWGGHMEIVTPKFTPESIYDQVHDLYKLGRDNGMRPRRSAGGAHVNFDLEFLKQLPVQEGTRKLSNLISFFESEQGAILFMWRHPKRSHSADVVQYDSQLPQKLSETYTSWDDYGRMLYNMRYFNTYVGRKPKYVPLNLTALMTDVVPDQYLDRTLDIKNAKQSWFPNFNKVHGRGEARLFDAPTDEYMAALQVKYWRAVLNYAFNSPEAIPLVKKYTVEDMKLWKENPELWLKAAQDHLTRLGLDPQEFTQLLWDSFVNQQEEAKPRDKVIFTNFLPAK